MDDRDRAEIPDEILAERLISVRHVLDEWSVPGGDALTYAQAKDLIWQVLAPFGLAMLGYAAVNRARQSDPVDGQLLSIMQRFTEVGDEVGGLVEQLLHAADAVRA